MKTLEISVRYASKANEAIEYNSNLSEYLEETSSTSYILNPDEDGFMDEGQLEDEVSAQLAAAGIPEDEFWFD